MEDIKNLDFGDIDPTKAFNKKGTNRNMDILYDIPITIKAKLGETKLTVKEILELEVDCVLELDSVVGDLVELYANDILIGRGEVVVLNDSLAIRIIELIEKFEENFIE